MPVLMPQVTANSIAASIASLAASKHSMYPQYLGHWDGWEVVQVTRKVRTKLGVAFERNEISIARPGTYEVEQPDASLPFEQWPTKTFRTVYSVRNGIDTGVPVEQVAPVEIAGVA